MYTQSITRNRRTALVFLLDCSGSMTEQITFNNRLMSKAEVVALLTNRTFFELVERARRTDGVRHYFDVLVLGYSGEGVKSLLGDQIRFYSITEIAQMGEELKRKATSEYTLPDGHAALLDEVPIPMWVTPTAAGETPMYEAMLLARDLLRMWVTEAENRDSFPPITINITDGEASDCDEGELRGVCDQIKSLSTNDGNALMINIHIASGGGSESILFPTADQANYGNRYASLLYDCSSEMPSVFDASIRDIRGGMPPFRGMSYNASVSELISILNIGSISLKTE